MRIGSTLLMIAGLLAVPTAGKADEVEPIYGVILRASGLAIQVMSRGCTTAGSFRVHVGQSKLGPDVLILRIKPDTCAEPERLVEVSLPVTDGDAVDQAVSMRNRLRVQR